jgi:hypothetical protein
MTTQPVKRHFPFTIQPPSQITMMAALDSGQRLLQTMRTARHSLLLLCIFGSILLATSFTAPQSPPLCTKSAWLSTHQRRFTCNQPTPRHTLVSKASNAELVEDSPEDIDWMPDRERARVLKQESRIYAQKITPDQPVEDTRMLKSANIKKRRREDGYLGDSTLNEIAQDFSVPICYLADVLCTWGMQPPIALDERLGDLVTGDQVFALAEAVHSLDVSTLQDAYSNMNIMQLCYEYDVDLGKAINMAVKEGWSLPFGVQTCLRVEQEYELLRVLGDIDADDDEYEYNGDYD